MPPGSRSGERWAEPGTPSARVQQPGAVEGAPAPPPQPRCQSQSAISAPDPTHPEPPARVLQAPSPAWPHL